ncbi:hypothetical protein GF342_00350 [Candidatus Woesearchaeota archaeon]|nr:hypothetical protein [Candidatus Woesearchaeota archaeon]
MWLIDTYQKKNKIVVWLKTKTTNMHRTYEYSVTLYAHEDAREFLTTNKIAFTEQLKKDPFRNKKHVLAITLSCERLAPFVRWFELGTKHRIPLYNADITPEQRFLYENKLVPCSNVRDVDGRLVHVNESAPPLSTVHLRCATQGPITRLEYQDHTIVGEEREVLAHFTQRFRQDDPDVLLMRRAYKAVPHLFERLRANGLHVPFHRWDEIPLRHRGGKTHFSYGRVYYQDHSFQLRGRLLVDTASSVGSTCSVPAIIELAQLTGTRFQRVAARSFGASFQLQLVKELLAQDLLVPYKEKPFDEPLRMTELFDADRAGHTFDPQLGFHNDVVAIDFSSMYPWIIHNYNISADTILTKKGKKTKIPAVPIDVTTQYQGVIPKAIKPLLDRRMYYKKHPTPENKRRAIGLKTLLVTCYGYLRFREFKMGLATSHMAICSYARELLLQSATLAEEQGFRVIHGIIDSLYISKKDITTTEVETFRKELEHMSGIPVACDGIFKWIVFLSRRHDNTVGVPARYFGAYKNGGIKARGIEVRQSSAPLLIRRFQQNVLEELAAFSTKRAIQDHLPQVMKRARAVLHDLPATPREELCCRIRISKTTYSRNIPQRQVIRLLTQQGRDIIAGQVIRFWYSANGPLLVDMTGRPDYKKYRDLLLRAIHSVYQPFGYTTKQLQHLLLDEYQSVLQDFARQQIRYEYVPMKKHYAQKRGLSERILRQRLERQGWTVWRGGSIHITRYEELYPNVRRKYELLIRLLDDHKPDTKEILQYYCMIQHGMPDFLCYKNGRFKFVECKLQYEQLSHRQKRCIMKLQDLGFDVEVHKLVDKRTKMREALVDMFTNCKIVRERQLALLSTW